MDTHIYVLFILTVVKKIEMVYWTPLTPIQFYENVLFECKIQTNGVGTSKWTGGYMNEILTYNEGSLYTDKYSAEFNQEKNVYYLNIKNFSEIDVNVVYTCFYGFDKYSKNLTMNEGQFELIPNNDTVIRMLYFTNGFLTFNVTFVKVWPSPLCSLAVNNTESTGLMKNHTRKGEMFLQSFFTYSQAINESVVFVNMSCMIGTNKMYTVFAEHLHNSNISREHESSTGIPNITDSKRFTSIPMSIIPIIIVVVAALIVFTVLFMIISIKSNVPKMHENLKRQENVAVNPRYTEIPQHNSASTDPTAAGPKPG